MSVRGPTTWQVSAMVRHVWAFLFFAALAGFFLGVEIGGYTKHGDEDPPVADLLGKPAVLIGMAIAMAITFAVIWAISAKLEGGDNWIGRLRPNPTQIHIDEVVRVKRTRPAKMRGSGATVQEVAFTVETADGRSIRVSEAAVHRQSKALMAIYGGAMHAAIARAGTVLAAGQPVVIDGSTYLCHDRIDDPHARSSLYFAQIAFVQVQIGTGVHVGAYNAAGKRIRQLPDDQMLLSILPLLGVKVDIVRVHH